MKNVTSLLLILVMLGVFIQSSQAVRCYQCGRCDEPTDEYCTGDLCVLEIWQGGILLSVWLIV